MGISENDVRKVAKLAAIALSPEDEQRIHRELSDILNYIEQLGQISTAGVSPTSHVHGVVNAFREDIIRDSLSLEQVEQNAPDFAQGFFRVPKIIG